MAEQVEAQVEDAPEHPAGYIPESEVGKKYFTKQYLEAEIKRRLKGKADPDALLADDEFRARALETWGVSTEAPAPAEPKGAALAAIYEKVGKEIEAKKVKPLEEMLTKLSAREQQRRREKLHAQILQGAAKVKINRELVEAEGNDVPPIIGMTEHLYAYSEEHDTWFRRDGEGFAASADGFKSVAEAMADFVKAKGSPAWLVADDRQRGAELSRPANGSKGSPSKPLSEWTAQEKADYITAHGPEKYAQLRQEQKRKAR